MGLHIEIESKNFHIADMAWMWDYDGVKQKPTVRRTLIGSQQKAIMTVAKAAKTAFVVTNSDASETARTFDPSLHEAGLNFIGEHGMVGKFSASEDWEFHPRLTVDRKVLPELARRAKELLIHTGIRWTNKGEDLQNGHPVIKVEDKMASFALVRTMGGFKPEEKDKLITQMNSITSFVMQTLKDEFKLEREGWSITIGADAQEFAQKGFSKQDGIEWLMERCGISSDQTNLIMHEDSNAPLLEWLHRQHKGTNIGVGEKYHGPEKLPYIFGSVADIDGFWAYQSRIANQIATGGKIDLGAALAESAKTARALRLGS